MPPAAQYAVGRSSSPPSPARSFASHRAEQPSAPQQVTRDSSAAGAGCGAPPAFAVSPEWLSAGRARAPLVSSTQRRRVGLGDRHRGCPPSGADAVMIGGCAGLAVIIRARPRTVAAAVMRADRRPRTPLSTKDRRRWPGSVHRRPGPLGAREKKLHAATISGPPAHQKVSGQQCRVKPVQVSGSNHGHLVGCRGSAQAGRPHADAAGFAGARRRRSMYRLRIPWSSLVRQKLRRGQVS